MVNYVAVKDKNKIIGAAMLLSITRRFGKKEFYSPRGFLIDFNDNELVDYFVKEVKSYVKKKGDIY